MCEEILTLLTKFAREFISKALLKRDMCERKNCEFEIHSNPLNNNGKYCCNKCMKNKGHGKFCERRTTGIVDRHLNKFIICKPRGGFCDMVSFITTALTYCEKFNRLLVIDTSKSLHFKDGFFKYFKTSNPNVYKGNLNMLYNSLNGKSIANTTTETCESFEPFRNSVPPINLSKNYNESIILLGCKVTTYITNILYFFKNFSITPIVSNVLKQRLYVMPKNYISVHVRNTDYRSNPNKIIKKRNKEFRNNPLFIASDDINTIQKFKLLFPNVYSFSNIHNSNDKCHGRKRGGIHFINRTAKKHELFNIDTLADFLIMSNSKKYYYTCHKSRFSRCANDLYKQKKIIRRIIAS